ncbi:hypothetical protein EDB83DRAFT_328654 [Lactarius deliciosus]|nr:hypothetical protein EDB83DRAFT_328654 [Lactarius deliciosus]
MILSAPRTSVQRAVISSILTAHLVVPLQGVGSPTPHHWHQRPEIQGHRPWSASPTRSTIDIVIALHDASAMPKIYTPWPSVREGTFSILKYMLTWRQNVCSAHRRM